MRRQRGPEPLLLVARVHARVHWGWATPGVRTNEGVDKSDFCMNSYKFKRNSHVIGTKWVQILTEFVQFHAYESATGLPDFATFTFWAPFGHGACGRGGIFTG